MACEPDCARRPAGLHGYFPPEVRVSCHFRRTSCPFLRSPAASTGSRTRGLDPDFPLGFARSTDEESD
jgi:hypothetical protein